MKCLKRLFEKKQLPPPIHEPERKNQKDFGDLVDFVPPVINDVNIHIKTHGKYLTKSGRAKGIVVHFTAGRFENGMASALGSLQYMAEQGYGCMVMDTDGNIYKAKNQKLNDIAWHAGSSSWMGQSSVSKYCFGMEIVNAGRLTEHNKGYYPWWCFRKGQFIGGNLVYKSNFRSIPAKNKNIVQGVYHKMTIAQEKSLKKILHVATVYKR